MNTIKNQRFQETEDRIYDCYLELLSDDPKKITVANICRKTGLNRSSFYLHFLDIPDLREKAAEKFFVERLKEEMKKRIDFNVIKKKSRRISGIS